MTVDLLLAIIREKLASHYTDSDSYAEMLQNILEEYEKRKSLPLTCESCHNPIMKDKEWRITGRGKNFVVCTNCWSNGRWAMVGKEK